MAVGEATLMGSSKPASDELPKKDVGEETVVSGKEVAGPAKAEDVPERRHFRRYRMSMPVWLSYGKDYRQVDSGLVRDISRAGIFLVTEGARDLQVNDVVKVNATFAVRGEARVVRVEESEEGPRGVGLEFLHKLEIDI